MPKDRIAIRFRNLYQLWQFAQTIQARSIEIRTKELLLFCDCSEEDLVFVAKFGGTVIQPEAVDN